jgi:hypothetical protein
MYNIKWYQRNTVYCRDFEHCAKNSQFFVSRIELEVTKCLITVSIYSIASVSSYSLWDFGCWAARSSGIWRHVTGQVTVPFGLLVPWNFALTSTHQTKPHSIPEDWYHSKTLICNPCMYAFCVLLKEARLCDWPHKAHCKSGGGDIMPTDLPTVRPTPPPTQPTLPPTSSTEGMLSSSGEVVSSTAGLPTVEPTRPPQSGTLSGNCVHALTCFWSKSPNLSS